jgi:four helix bundle suffix protein
MAHNNSDYYRRAVKERNDTAIANIAITLIFQDDKLLKGLIEHLKQEFLEQGGMKEQMYNARVAYRAKYGSR